MKFIKALRTHSILLGILLLSISTFAQKAIVKGRVVADSSVAVEYATVYLKNTSLGTVTDENGAFCIHNVAPGNYTLVFAHVNYVTVEKNIELKARQLLDVVINTQVQKSEANEIVITATQTEKSLEDSPIPVTLITETQIQQMGSMRLNEVLQEQTGLAIVSDHGTGVQLQGFSPEYTLIMVDGSPLIGRTAGTLDLSRVTVGNIKQIEIIKGASSSLYGSEALAGVINIITKTPTEKMGIQARTRLGTYNTVDISADAFLNTKRLQLMTFVNRYSTDGYDLQPISEDKTVAPYHNYTLQQKINYSFNARLKISITARGFYEKQNSITTFSENATDYRIQQEGHQYDWSILPQVFYSINEKKRLQLKVYSTYYHTKAVLTNTADQSLYDDSYFNQSFTRPELLYYHTWNKKNETVVGAGMSLESVNSTRYTTKQTFHSTFYYIQHDWHPIARLNIVGGFRFDWHSVYGNQLSPKLAIKYVATKKVTLRASVGTGFKAPDFRQLYLNFTNPVAGYSVFGSEEVLAQYNTLAQQGLIAQTFIDPNTLKPITAERSISFNMGFTMDATKKISWQFNVFRNDVSNMIETSAIAMKTNGQSVYTYYNISQVFTQGIETNVSYKVHPSLTFSAGYQYLIAKNKEVLNDIEDGKYFARDPATLVTSMVKENQYGGLFNRSKNMANAKLFYMHKKTGWNASVRVIYRGKYGFGDVNGNLILDADNEYVKGYCLTNISVGKTIKEKIDIQFGVDNVFNYTNPSYITTIPGRLFYTSVQIKLFKK